MQFTSVNPSTPMIMLELTRLLIMRNDEKQVCLLVDNVIDA